MSWLIGHWEVLWVVAAKDVQAGLSDAAGFHNR